MALSLRRALLGRPIATAHAVSERLPKWVALPVFASDAVSSTAYATEEILIALLLASTAALSASLPHRRAVVNSVGTATTFAVMVILAVTRFMPPDSNVLFRLPFTLPGMGDTVRSGAWLVVVAIVALEWIFARINRHYRAVASQLTLIGYTLPPQKKNTVIVLVPAVHRGILPALQYAKSLEQDTRAVHIEMDPEATPRLRNEWEPWGQGIPLLILESPYRSLVEPLFRYLDEVQVERNHLVTLIVPEFVPAKGWHRLLHNQSGLLLKVALLFRKDVIVTNVRYHLTE